MASPEHNTPLPQAISQWLKNAQIEQCRLIVGVSGGADSVGLLRAIHVCRESLSLDICVAHLDHGLRAESHEDAAWVRSLAGQLGLPIVNEQVDIERSATASGKGVEETARRARYDFFLRVATERRCSHVAVAHTADDQAETILHNVIRGTGLRGLRGMPALRPLSPVVTLIRPLLDVPRCEVLSYLNGLGQDFRFDPSNEDERYTRNRLRHTLLPMLREQFNPRISESLTRLGHQVEDVQNIIEQRAAELLSAATVDRHPHEASIDSADLQNVDRHLVRELLRKLWTEQDWPLQRMGFDDWERLATMIQSLKSPLSLDLPHGVRAQRKGTHVSISRPVSAR